MQPAVDIVNQASRFSWEAWFAVVVLLLIVSVYFAVKWILKKHEELLQIIQNTQKEKDHLFQEMLEKLETSNKNLIAIVERNSLQLAQNTEALSKHA